MLATNSFFEITPNNWEEAKDLGKLLDFCVFRGHADQSWELSTTLERAANCFNSPRQALWMHEKDIINRFRARAHNYIQSPPKDEDYIEWLSLIQDYGGPTRLLDFTRSFNIAAFFAMEFAEKDLCIWAVNYVGLFVRAVNKKHIEPSKEEWLSRVLRLHAGQNNI